MQPLIFLPVLNRREGRRGNNPKDERRNRVTVSLIVCFLSFLGTAIQRPENALLDISLRHSSNVNFNLSFEIEHEENNMLADEIRLQCQAISRGKADDNKNNWIKIRSIVFWYNNLV